MIYLLGIAAVAGALGAVTGWIAAFRARGESRDSLSKANKEAERARIAEVARDAARAKVLDADSRAETALAEFRVAKETESSLRSELARERAEKAQFIDALAKRGVPVGDVLVDSSMDRLFEDENRRGTEGSDRAGPGTSDDRANVPGDDADAAGKTKPK